MSITPDRTTVVTLDPADNYIMEPIVCEYAEYVDIANPGRHRRLGQLPSTTFDTDNTDPGWNVIFDSALGWTLAGTKHALEFATETADWDPGFLGMTTHSSVNSRLFYKANTDLPGVTLGANQQSSGFGVYQREVSASGSFDGEFTADVAAYPRPSMPNEEIQSLRRVAISTNTLSPLDELHCSFVVTGWDQGSRGALYRIFFSSLAGYLPTDGTAKGLGQYSLTILGSGRAVLHERMDDSGSFSWKYRADYHLPRLGRGAYIVHISSNAIELQSGVFSGDAIKIEIVEAQNERDSAVSTYIALGTSHAKYNAGDFRTWVYKVPGANTWQPSPERFRLEERRDIRSSWTILSNYYYDEGSLFCYTFDSKHILSNNEPLWIEAFGNCPSDSSIDIFMFDAETRMPLTKVATEVRGKTCTYAGFDPTSGRTDDTTSQKYTRRQYYVIFRLKSSSDHRRRPFIRAVRYFRNAIQQSNSPTPVEIGIVNTVNIAGQDSDATHETATIFCYDPTNALENPLNGRAEMPIRVDVRYDPEDETKVSTIFNGYVSRAKKKIRGGKPGKPYPADNWSEYEITCTGEWLRLMQAKTSKTYAFVDDFNDHALGIATGAAPMKITNIIRLLLQDAGYADENILIPDYPIRFFSGGQGSNGMVVESFTEIYPLIAQLANMYLGGWITWDANASASATPTKMGAWRLLLPQRAQDFVNLAHFKKTPDLVTGSGPRIGLPLPYQAKDEDDVQTVWMRKDTFFSYIVPPEGNAVFVTGTGVASSGMLQLTTGADKGILTCLVHNFSAAKFFSDQPSTDGHGNPIPDPNSMDYTNGRPNWIYIGDGGLQTQAAVNFVARRVFDMACHAQKRVVFEAPLLLIDQTATGDEYQRQPRPLRFGDPVKVEGDQYVVSNVSPYLKAEKGGSRVMMAVYELFSQASFANWKTAGTFK